MKILLLEDDPILGQALEVLLRLEGYEVFWSQSIKKVDLDEEYHLALLDIGLPDGSGLDFAKTLREVHPQIPFIFLTAVVEESTLIEAFDSGASDYIKKPFSNRELLARIKANTRESNSSDGRYLRGPLLIDLKNRILKYENKPVSINPHQLKIFYYLLLHEGEVVTREQLLSFLGKENESFDRSVDTQMSYLRKLLKDQKMNQFSIKSVYGAGYKIEILH